MTTFNHIESLLLMFFIWSLRLAFLAAGCWMMYNGWYGCGLTTIILSVFIAGKYDRDSEEEDKAEKTEKELSSAKSCRNCKKRLYDDGKFFACSKYGDFPSDQIVPCRHYEMKDEYK